MASELLFPDEVDEVSSARRRVRWERFERRGPILRPGRGSGPGGTYGVDLTAGCPVACPFCHVRAARWYPGEGRILFDPTVPLRLARELDALDERPGRVVLSPTSDPFPPDRSIRDASGRVVETLLERSIPVVILTRGRIPGRLIDLLARHAAFVRVAVPLITLDPRVSRVLEPHAAPTRVRLSRLRRLVEAGVSVEARLEPLLPGLTDTAENLRPLFLEVAATGLGRVLAHYLFLHPKMTAPLKEALRPLGWGEKLEDDFVGGPVFPLGSLGQTKHLPLETRQAGFAALALWGAEHGLTVETGSAQNPDLPVSPFPRGQPESGDENPRRDGRSPSPPDPEPVLASGPA